MSKVREIADNDWGSPVSYNGKHIYEYDLWMHMLERSLSEDKKVVNKSYKDVSCSTDWLSMRAFINDVSKMVGYGIGWQLDKDLLSGGIKIYSKDTCCFLPSEINCAITVRNKSNNLPNGVTHHKNKGKFQAQCRMLDKRKYLGLFETPDEAFSVYKIAKENHLKDLAEKWKGKIDNRAYDALINYEVEK